MESLNEFIQNNPDPRELKRALAVKMVEQNYNYAQISELLGVSLGFIRNYRQQFLNHGIEGLRLKYQGSKGYLSSQQKQDLIDWLQQQDYWQLSELRASDRSRVWRSFCQFTKLLLVICRSRY